ncbi:DUF4097 family beta strand repeat-containing protein [Heyndrickxia coagulans]|uniref:DUF4097 family beta strand repeat-containing protein n=1 Tax=Heyndrickxia coagulans TaxID=1398 RepID=UPI000376CB1F|nr:DUF4097 family beta strand repeat-containing protein [Heyndrickxia coagulans]
MDKIKKMSLVALVLLLVGIVGSLLTFRPVFRQEAKLEEKVIHEKFSRIQIATDNTAIEILPATGSAAKITVSGRAEKGSAYHLSTDVKNAVLSINVKYKQRNFVNFFPSSSSLKVYVPKKWYESLQINSNDGRVRAGDFRAREMRIHVRDGKIELNRINADTITTEASDGSSILENVKASLVKVKSDDGKIVLKHLDSRVSGKTTDGSILFITRHLNHPVELRAIDGNIKIQTEKKPDNATISASTVDGKVNVFGSSNRNMTFGRGKSMIQLFTADGSVTVEKTK